MRNMLLSNFTSTFTRTVPDVDVVPILLVRIGDNPVVAGADGEHAGQLEGRPAVTLGPTATSPNQRSYSGANGAGPAGVEVVSFPQAILGRCRVGARRIRRSGAILAASSSCRDFAEGRREVGIACAFDPRTAMADVAHRTMTAVGESNESACFGAANRLSLRAAGDQLKRAPS